MVGVAASASEGRVDGDELRQRPLTREGEMLEAVPGMIVTQHSGDGKANQYFVRGFNLDHGTDFETRVDGMPVNMPSHAHGQGYTDLNFLIPEMVERLDYTLGVYHAERGDFGSAGGADFHMKRRLDRDFIAVGGGENGLARLVAGASNSIGGGTLLLGGEAKYYNGPWDVGEGVRKLSALARYSWDRGQSSFSLSAMAYHNRWTASDQIPSRAVADGMIDRFGQVDSTDGGRTERYSVSGTWRHLAANSIQSVDLFAIYSDLSLYSDFTFFLDDPQLGDQFNQREHRVVLGGNASQRQQLRALGADHLLSLGLQTRTDIVTGLGLYHAERQQEISSVRRDDVTESSTGLYAAASSPWSRWLRTELGVRADLYTFDVRSDLAENSGQRTAAIASPKASLILTPWTSTELYASAGFGFHSNDARGTTIRVDPVSGQAVAPVSPLVRSRGAELGMRAHPASSWQSTLSFWWLALDSELLFAGDGGTTEPSSRSARHGVTFTSVYRPLSRLAVDADVSLSRARFQGVEPGKDFVPGALERVLAAGVSWSAAKHGAFGAVRIRHFGSYPLIEDNTVRATPSTLLNAEAGYAFRDVRLQLTVMNILDPRADDIQYYYASRLRGEPATGIGDVHFHPVEPRQLRASMGWEL
jgi:hypothetical protein